MGHSFVQTPESLGEALQAGGLLIAVGPNFSGRSSLLRSLTGLPPADPVSVPALPHKIGVGAYVGPEIYNSLSALAPTVAEELRLASVGDAALSGGLAALRDLGFAGIQDRNPFQVSGGEQAVVAAISAALGRPQTLALDCCLEQIDSEVRAKLLDRLLELLPKNGTMLLADNRLSEYPNLDNGIRLATQKFLVGGIKAPPIEIRTNQCLVAPNPCTLGLGSVYFSYPGGPQVLRGCTAQLEPGNAYLLQGPNGSGKSTLARILCGALRPVAGRIYVNGREVRPWLRPAETVAYHFQNPDLQLFSHTVWEEVTAGIPQRLTGPERDRITRALLEVFGLSDVAQAHPLDLPFVLRKRVALAATLSMLRPWLILDEPTLGQDDRSTEGLVALLHSLCSVGYGIIVITHSSFLRAAVTQHLTLDAGTIHTVGQTSS